ncbi:MAG TPA: ABC transporter ATP-binding protein [Cellulomonas sp.]
MLEITGLTVGYGRLDVLRGLDLSLGFREVVGVLGHNGAGKSTLLKALSGTLRPQTGSMTVDGAEIVGRTPAQIVRAGLVHCPVGRRLFENETVEFNVRIGAYTRTDRAGIARDLAMWRDRFPILATMARRRAGDLSGGQQQIVALVRAMMARPRVLLLDEPSMGLSPRAADEVFAVIAGLRDQGVTILIAEQNVGRVLALADRAVVIETGRIVLSGASAQLRESDEIRTAFLGAPAKTPPPPSDEI